MKKAMVSEYLGHISPKSLIGNLELAGPNAQSYGIAVMPEQCKTGLAVKAELEVSYPETWEEADALFQGVHSKRGQQVKLLRIVLEPL